MVGSVAQGRSSAKPGGGMWRSSGKGSKQGRTGLLDSLGRHGALLRRRWKGQRDQSITDGEQLLEDSLT